MWCELHPLLNSELAVGIFIWQYLVKKWTSALSQVSEDVTMYIAIAKNAKKIHKG